MFRVVTTKGIELGVTEVVNYIKISKSNGCYVSATREGAIGVAFNSKAYNLFGHDEIKDAETVIVSKFDGGKSISHLNEKNKALTEQLAETDEAAIELYEKTLTQEETNAEQDEAIIEIYEMIGDVING